VSAPRPGYREQPAHGALACLWVRVAAEEGERTDVLPDGCSDLIWSPGRGAFIAGPDTGPAPVQSPPAAVLLGIRFRPGAGGPALGVPLSELRDRRVELADIDPALARRLHGDLDPREAARRLERLARELAAAPEDPVVAAAVARLADPAARVEALAGEVALSERQLRRRLHAAVGYGPKTLQRVLRFQRVLAGLAPRNGSPESLARLAASAGYSDQAHMSRETRELSGLTPLELARTRELTAGRSA
jgi:AraC-like DNA-binding protein